MARRVSPTKAVSPAGAQASLFEKRSLSTGGGLALSAAAGWSVQLDHTFPYGNKKGMAVAVMVMMRMRRRRKKKIWKKRRRRRKTRELLRCKLTPTPFPSSSLFAGLSRRKPKAHKPSLMKRLKLQKDAKQARAAGSVLVIDEGGETPMQGFGVPLGGLGGGTIGRGWRGDFNRWQLQPGVYTHKQVAADQFVLLVRQDGETLLHQVLYPGKLGKYLGAWSWTMSGAQARYRALYPQAWTEYTFPEIGLRLTCRQVSPVLPHNYAASAMPCATFEWTAENTSMNVMEVTITFTFQNGTGMPDDKLGGHTNHLFSEAIDHSTTAVGVLLRHSASPQQPSYTMAIAAAATPGVKVTRMARFNARSTGGDVWLQMASGALDDRDNPTPSLPGERIAAAVSASVKVRPRTASTASFALAWDMPAVTFPARPEEQFFRWYTRFFGRDGQAAPKLCAEALALHKNWQDV